MKKYERKELTTLLILFLFFTIGAWFFIAGCQKVIVISQSDDTETSNDFSVDNDTGFMNKVNPTEPQDFIEGKK